LAAAGADVDSWHRNRPPPRQGRSSIDQIARGANAKRQSNSSTGLSWASVKNTRRKNAQRLEGTNHQDLLINNAGIRQPPNRETTADGFELQSAGQPPAGQFA